MAAVSRSWTYDALGRVVEAVDGDIVVTLVYDANGLVEQTTTSTDPSSPLTSTRPLPDGERLTQFLLNNIRQWRGVQATQTLIPGLAIIKDQSGKEGLKKNYRIL